MPSVYYPKSNGKLPVSVYQEKFPRTPGWFTTVYITLPGPQKRHLRIYVPTLPRRLQLWSLSRKRGVVLLAFTLLFAIFTIFALAKRFGTEEKTWPTPFTGDPPTLIFKREDLQRIWKWEISSGHYPSRRSLPPQLGLKHSPSNPALPPRKTSLPSRFRPPPGAAVSTSTIGNGAKRVYLDIQSQYPSVAYPPRPVPGSIADLDIVMQHCDFSEKKFVRDCLEVLRLGAGLDNGNRLRRGKMDDWKYIYLEQAHEEKTQASQSRDVMPQDPLVSDPDYGLTKRRNADWEIPPIRLPQPVPYSSYSELTAPCDSDYPRIFHMFWTGPFTDKPYLALLSFLYTQNLGLHTQDYPVDTAACRPQFWLWINQGPAAAVPNPHALHNMYEQLKASPWAAPFLHPRFKDVIQFKLWNTTEQLDGVPEIKDHWRNLGTLFNSGGHIVNVKSKTTSESEEGDNESGTKASNAAPTANGGSEEDDMENRVGSKSASSYDRLSVILSDMARFLLCHRFGGIYLDADTIFLRDWEELWGWKGAFAYRWSRLEKYNTAVLHLNKGSALGTFLFKTALKNELDFHPMTISRYMKDAHIEGLLLRLPDALFDSAWLNTEYYQRERPPQPYFTKFGDFFDTPLQNSAAPQALGFNGFFRGAFSYHFHNYWWKPFDPTRNYPDLGPRFPTSNQSVASAPSDNAGSESDDIPYVDDDQRDLDWSTVLKRTFEAHVRGEVPNMYGEYIVW